MSVAGMSANLEHATRPVRLFGNIISWKGTDVRRSAKGLCSLIVAFSVPGVIARRGAGAGLATSVFTYLADVTTFRIVRATIRTRTIWTRID